MFDLKTFYSIDRPQLADLEGQFIRLRGTVVNVSSPSPDTKLVCIGKPKIAPVNNEVHFEEALIDTVDHLWVDVSVVTTMPHAIGQKVESVARVYSYERKDGSKSFSIELVRDTFYLEAGFVQQLKDYFWELNNGQYTLDERVLLVDSIIKKTKELMASGEVVLFSRTTQEVMDFLEHNRTAFMQMANVNVTLNREGRRLSRRPRSRCRQQTTAMGFA